ncbi:hypothetical protein CK203_055763 [Vitis vinifera]|uniref:Uncharacterized protein n=1 Tax=Vitis vinifera TaxID=29760 RepID=A0A438H1D4_VITVI|nr:hypothetical protein CK203_055763 [Vitis vinifera]
MRILEMVVAAATKPRGGLAPSFGAWQLRLIVMMEIKSPEIAKSRRSIEVSCTDPWEDRLQPSNAEGNMQTAKKAKERTSQKDSHAATPFSSVPGYRAS